MSAGARFWPRRRPMSSRPRLTRRACLRTCLLGLALLPGTAWASQGDPTADPRLARIVGYLNRLDTLEGRFLQTSSNGAVAGGSIALQRPGRLRFEYDPPHPLLIIADGTLLLIYDRDLDQATFLPLSQSPLWFLLRDQVTLDSSVEVIGIEEAEGFLHLTLNRRDAEADESLPVRLTFSEPPLVFRRWAITDFQGIETQVRLLETRQGGELDPELFATGRYNPNRLRLDRDR